MRSKKTKTQKISLKRKLFVVISSLVVFFMAFNYGIRGFFTRSAKVYTGGRYYRGRIVKISDPGASLYVSAVNTLLFTMVGLTFIVYGLKIFPSSDNFFKTLTDPKIDEKVKVYMKIYYFLLVISLLLYLTSIPLALLSEAEYQLRN